MRKPHPIRPAAWLWAVASCVAPAPGAAQSDLPNASEVVVEARWTSHSNRGCERLELWQLIGWTSGELWLPKEFGTVVLRVERTLEGELRGARQTSTGLGLEVCVLNDAGLALAARENAEETNRWRLTRLANGAHVVTELDDLPFGAGSAIEAERATVAELAEDLDSGVARRQGSAILRLQRKGERRFDLVPSIVALVDSREPLSVPHWPPVWRSRQSLLGVEAERLLRDMLDPSELPDPTSASWKQWWDEAIRRDPFPRVRVVPGTLHRLDRTDPLERLTSPLSLASTGRVGLFASGDDFHLLDLEAAGQTRTLFARPARNRRWSRARPATAVAWDDERPVVSWAETRMLPRGLRISIEVEGVRQTTQLPPSPYIATDTALATDATGWVLVYATMEQILWAQRLKPNATAAGEPRPIWWGSHPPSGPRGIKGFLSVAHSSRGPIVAFGGGWYETLSLVFLDEQLQPRKTVSAAQPGRRRFDDAHIARNGETLCVAWVDREHLFTRLYDLDGVPRTAVIPYEAARSAARPVAHGKAGFALAWVRQSDGWHQIRHARIDTTGEPSEIKTIVSGAHLIDQVEMAIFDGTARFLFEDSSGIGIKDIELSELLTDRATSRAQRGQP